MTTAKPTDTFRWANVGGSIVVPPSGKLDVGHVTGERPPAQYENYLKNGAFQWHNFVDKFFTNSGGVVGSSDLGNPAEATVTPLAMYRDYLGNARSLVDHNGYRMGEVSEVDEHWGVAPVTIQVPLTAAVPESGTWAFSTSNNWNNTVSGALALSLDNFVPPNSLITSVVFTYARTTAGDSQTFSLRRAAGGTTVPFVTKTIASGTGNSSTDLMVSPTSGQGPQFIGDVADTCFLLISSTITTSFQLLGVSVTYITLPAAWTYTNATTSSGGDKFSVVDPQSGLNQRALQIIGAAIGGVAGFSAVNPNFETFHDANCAYAIEWTCKTGVVTDGSAHRLFGLGVQNANGGSNNRFVWFYTDNTFANWQLQVIGSATANTDTGVAVAASTVYRMRLEIYGSSVNSSGNTKIRAYINGVKVAEVNSTTLPAADKIRPYFKVGTNGTTGGPYDVTIGRVRRAWNHLLAGDNL